MRVKRGVLSTGLDSKAGGTTSVIWRRGWGSNPRSRCQDSSFRDQSEPESGGNQTSGKSEESLDASGLYRIKLVASSCTE